jgi:hypothetical protein
VGSTKIIPQIQILFITSQAVIFGLMMSNLFDLGRYQRREVYKPKIPLVLLDCAKVREMGCPSAVAETRAITLQILADFG